MRYYLLRLITDLAATTVRWSATGRRRWGLPGTECPECGGGGGGVGLDYPSADLSSLPEEREYRRARLAPWDEYVRLRDLCSPFLPPGAVVEPGMGMGPLVGRVRGRPPQVAMDGVWHLYAQPEGVERLVTAGLRGIKPEPTALNVSRDVPPLLELELLVAGDYALKYRPEPLGEPCPICGIQQTTEAPYLWELDEASLPEADVFRFFHHPGCIIASERFVEVLRGMGDTGIRATEIVPPAAREAGAL
ncbi:double-CXXCG motif protein [Myxococcus stipitatus]|uniref:SitI6 family double-CXXCG motif immunity protein n=1 Tax=Myxococcus stipitatus TaxID=83455 RepID=UPI001F203EE1|nr:double-CXXCG motif protein [Myxococcus stipitatus]MCE9667773.1 double-CXXCG motif protein [Myxococcus stipitatus]